MTETTTTNLRVESQKQQRRRLSEEEDDDNDGGGDGRGGFSGCRTFIGLFIIWSKSERSQTFQLN